MGARRSIRRRLVAGLAIAAVTVVGGPSSPAAAEPAAGEPAAATATDPATSVTLITGDRLTLLASDQVAIERGPGREHVTFSMRRVRDHLHVVPADAVPYLQAGRLDPRLFDLTALLEYGYDDRRGDLPLIVTGATAPRGTRMVRELSGLDAVVASAERDSTSALWRSITASQPERGPTIWLDGMRHPTLDISVPQIGAPAAWQAGYDGTGVTVAVVDTGIDATHPDLAGKVVAQHNFVEDEEDELDRVGHGTHVAATVAGAGAASGGRYTGVAPGAELVDAKVCLSFGCPESAILAGMQWAVAEQHATVVNMSLSGSDTPGVDPLEQAVADLTEQYGALFVIAAGNSGTDRSVGSPSSADAALAVGAVDDHDALAAFSSRGPRVGDAALKPDITAPGVDITAARSSHADQQNGDPYLTLSGTSMATPHVAGAAAILAQRRPDWRAPALKAALMASAQPNPAIGAFGQGAGRVDVPRALDQTVTTSPASISFGQQRWPHDDDTPLARTVSYRNDGDAAVTFSLALETAGPDGAPTPPGMFALDRSTLIVPAGGTAEATVTADTRVAGPDGFAGGHLVAIPTGSGPVTRTALAVDKEVESYDVTLEHTNRAGQPTDQYQTLIASHDSGAFFDAYDPDGTAEIRVPKGRYFVWSLVFDGDPDATMLTSQLLEPMLDVDEPQRVVLDARTAQPVSVTVPRPSAQQVHGGVLSAIPTTDGGDWVFGLAADTFDTTFVGAAGGDPRLDGLVTKVDGQWLRAGPDGSVDDSPYQYNLAWTERGRAITGFHRDVHRRDLATVRADYLTGIPGAVAAKAVAGRAKGIEFGGVVPASFHPPVTRTEYVNSADDLWWDVRLDERESGEPDGDPAQTVMVQFGLSYQAGRSYSETWNQAVFGPSLPGGYDPSQIGWVTRSGDTILANLPTFGDGSGRAGLSTGLGRVALYRDGVLVDEVETNDFAVFDVPPEPGRYRLEVASERGAPFILSTRVTGVWEFTSGHVDPAGMVPLPLSVVRFTPHLDRHNTAPAGRAFALPVTVQAQLGSSAVPHVPEVEVSYDDGATWQPVTLRQGAGGGWRAILHHPDRDGFVSLRAAATDGAGNTVDQTIIRAYRIA